MFSLALKISEKQSAYEQKRFFMQENYSSQSYFQEKPRRILGIPEKTIYRIGVLVFYILLFFAISFFSKKVQIPQNETYNSSVQNGKP